VILQADLLLAQDKTTEAETLLADARSRSPQDLELWVKLADILRRQRKYSEAGTLLDQAHKTGDMVNLRLARAQLLVAQGGADLSKALGALAENTNAFLPADRRLLERSQRTSYA
jgi:predicted Zn-dependent protease